MNKQRRTEITQVYEELSGLLSQLGELRDQEQDYYDNMPESFKDGEKGQAAEAAASALENAYDYLEEVMSNLEESLS